MGISMSSLIDAPVDEVFAWFERPGAFTRLMPPWQPMRVGVTARRTRRDTGPARADHPRTAPP